MDCNKITRTHLLARCGNSNPGIEPDLFLINRDDVQSVEVVDGVVTGLTLKNGAYACRFQGRRNSYDAGFSMQKGTYLNTMEHRVICRSFVKTQALKDALNALRYARVMVIVNNSDGHNEQLRYEVYGYQNGLQMSDIDYTGNEQDGWLASFTLQSPDKATESGVPATFYNTDLKTTYLLLLALTQLEWFTLDISRLNSNMKLK